MNEWMGRRSGGDGDLIVDEFGGGTGVVVGEEDLGGGGREGGWGQTGGGHEYACRLRVCCDVFARACPSVVAALL